MSVAVAGNDVTNVDLRDCKYRKENVYKAPLVTFGESEAQTKICLWDILKAKFQYTGPTGLFRGSLTKSADFVWSGPCSGI